MPQIVGPSQLERVAQVPARHSDDARRAKMMGRLATLGELLRGATSLDAVTAAIGRAALMLTGASRCAVFIRTPNGAVMCPWSHQLSDTYISRLCTPGGPNAWAHLSHHLELSCMDLAARGRARSTVPSIIEDICVLPAVNEARRAAMGEAVRAFCSWPLGRAGRVFGAVVYFFDAPHVCGDPERELLLAFVVQASAALERVLTAEPRTQGGTQPAAESPAGVLPGGADAKMRNGAGPAAGIRAEAGTGPSVFEPIGTARESETDTARLAMLQRVVQAEAARLLAERTDLRAERDQLAAAHRELEAERGRLAEVRRALEAEQKRLAQMHSAAHANGAQPAAVQMERSRSERLQSAAHVAPAERKAAPAPAGGPESSYTSAPAESPRAAASASAVATAPSEPAERPASGGVAVQSKTTAVERTYLDSLKKYRERIGRWAEVTAAALRCSINEIAEIREATALLYDVEASSRASVPLSVAAILRHREEHWDGKGQPDGLQGNAIPLGARLLAVTLAYAEMVIGAPGSPMLYYLDAKAALKRDAGARFDPDIVKAFCAAVDRT